MRRPKCTGRSGAFLGIHLGRQPGIGHAHGRLAPARGERVHREEQRLLQPGRPRPSHRRSDRSTTGAPAFPGPTSASSDGHTECPQRGTAENYPPTSPAGPARPRTRPACPAPGRRARRRRANTHALQVSSSRSRPPQPSCRQNFSARVNACVPGTPTGRADRGAAPRPVPRRARPFSTPPWA